MSDTRKPVTIEKYRCPKCGMKMFVPRKKKREMGHIKNIYCIFCKEKMPFIKDGENR